MKSQVGTGRKHFWNSFEMNNLWRSVNMKGARESSD